MNSDRLPSVLSAPPNSISMERALKQIKELLCDYLMNCQSINIEDRLNASIDDCETMIQAIDRN